MKTAIKFAVGTTVVVASFACLWFFSSSKQKNPALPGNPAASFDSSVASQQEAVVGGSIVESANITQTSNVLSNAPVFTSGPSLKETVLTNKSSRPSWELCSAFTKDDEAQLLELYSSETELTNRKAITLILARVGSDAAANMLVKTLTNDYSQRVLNLDEWKIMRDTVQALGFVASRSEIAHQFLRDASSAQFWHEHRSWKVELSGEDVFTHKRFAGLAIQALGASARTDITQKLEEWKQADPKMLRDYTGSITEAAFNNEFVTAKGVDELLRIQLSGQLFDLYKAWHNTENGRQWRAWYDKAMRSGNY